MSLMRSVLLRASRSAWLRDHAMRTPYVRRATRRFMPGEDLEDALAASRELERESVGTILTRLGENLESEADALAVMHHYLDAQERLRETGIRSEMSVKLTQLGLDLDRDLALEHLLQIARHAQTIGRSVWVDMEGSTYTGATIELFRRAHAQCANLGIAIQSYLRRSAADLETLIADGAAVRLVKGAYDEPESIAFRTRREVDESYIRLGERLLSAEALTAGVFPGFGTHDRRIIAHLRSRAAAQGVGEGALRVRDAVRHPSRPPGPARARRASHPRADQLRRGLVPLVHAPPRRAAGERLVRGAQRAGRLR